MILFTFEENGLARSSDLENLFKGGRALLIGGAPSLLEQPLAELSKRGVLTMAMNNAARHFQPDLWIGSDNPACYDPRILLDPKITKFAPRSHSEEHLGEEYAGWKFREMPRMFFYGQDADVPYADFLERHQGVPWYKNTLMAAIHVLYRLGIRSIILGGSDFGMSKDGRMYAHPSTMGSLQKKWNIALYNSQAETLRIMQKYFKSKNLEIIDCSVNSRLGEVYRITSMEKAVEYCLQQFPKQEADPATLPHCSVFAPERLKRGVAGCPMPKVPDTESAPQVAPVKTNGKIKAMHEVL